VSLKPGHMDWVRDFDFMLNLFSLSSPWNHYLFIRRIPYRSLWSHPRNCQPVNSREPQSLAAATISQRFGHCICSKLKYVECTKYVRVQAWTRVCERSVYVVFQVVLLNELLLLWWCVTCTHNKLPRRPVKKTALLVERCSHIIVW